jgi:hypothetical protein
VEPHPTLADEGEVDETSTRSTRPRAMFYQIN